MVIVDTSVWVEFLRRNGSPEHLGIDRLLQQGQVVMVGPVLTEVLQGARSSAEFERLRYLLVSLRYAQETPETWIRAGDIAYQLRQQGLSLALIDLLIATLALQHDYQLYTLDEHFQRVPGLKLYKTT